MNCTMFGDLNLNASRRFVSDSWVSCITARRRYAWRVLATATWLAEAGWVAVCHSRYCIKTTKRILKRFRPPGSLIIIFKLMGPLAPIPNSKGTPSAGALNTRGMGKIGDFRRISPFITIFRIVQLSMTLSDLWPRFQGRDIFWGQIS